MSTSAHELARSTDCLVRSCPDAATQRGFCQRHYEKLSKAAKVRAALGTDEPGGPRAPTSRNPPAVEEPATMRSVLEDVPNVGVSGMVNPRNLGSVVAGLRERPAPTKTGLHLLTPEQVAGLRISRVKVGSSVTGYQRDLRATHARTIARRMAEGFPFPPILYAIAEESDEPGEIVDGQHRAAGAIISRTPVWAVAFFASPEERAQLFSSQRAAAAIDPATLILSGDKPWHDYARRMLTDAENPWRALITKSAGVETIGLASAWSLATRYAVRNIGDHTPPDEVMADRWDPQRADEFAELLSVLPSKRSMQAAWSIRCLRSLKNLALLIGEIDQDRWALRVSRFDYPFAITLPKTSDILEALIDHWNLGLPAAHHVRNPRGAA